MTSTTNIYYIALRLLPNTPFAVCVSADNRRQEKPPVLMRGVPAIMKIALFNDGGRIAGAALDSLYTAFRLVLADDFDNETAPVVVSDGGEGEVDLQNDCLVVPVSSMNTEELAALIGTRERIDLGAELQLFNSSVQEEPIVAYHFPVSIQNRRDLTGDYTPAPGSINYPTNDDVAAAIASAQGISSQTITTLSGAYGTVEPGKVYSLVMTEDFELSAAALASGSYGESIVFVTPGDNTFSVASGITLDAEMGAGMRYRLLVSWTPLGVLVETSGEWIAS